MKSTRTKVLAIGAAVIIAVAAALAQGMHGHGGPGGFEHMLGFFTDYLDLTTAQQDQIKSIMQKEKPGLEPLMQQMKTFHSQMSQLEQSGPFDEAKVRALANQQSQTMVELAVQHARIKSEMVQVLTADQKAKLAKLEARHEQHMQHGMPVPPSD